MAKRAGVILNLATTLAGSEQPVWSPPRQGTSSSRTTHVVATLCGGSGEGGRGGTRRTIAHAEATAEGVAGRTLTVRLAPNGVRDQQPADRRGGRQPPERCLA